MALPSVSLRCGQIQVLSITLLDHCEVIQFIKSFLCICTAILVAFSAVTAFAADVTGAWSGEAKGPNGERFQLTFTFKQDGTKLTGTVTGPQVTQLTSAKVRSTATRCLSSLPSMV
jgi:hypothetical protein